MTFSSILIIVAVIFLTFFRAFLNAEIWNSLHNKKNELFVNANSIEDVDDSTESVLFGLYCSLIFIWFKFKKEDKRKVVYSTSMSVISILLICLLIFI